MKLELTVRSEEQVDTIDTRPTIKSQRWREHGELVKQSCGRASP
jgi:hypothetical protein